MISKKMKTAAAFLFAVFAVAAVVVAPAFAVGADTPVLPPLHPKTPERVADWDGWTFDQSQYKQFSPEWVEEVQNHIIECHNDKTHDREWQDMAQAYILGWDDRIGYALCEGNINRQSGQITYNWGFFGNLLGLGVPEQFFTTTQELDYFMNIYGKNYSAAHISIFEDEIEEMKEEHIDDEV